MQSAMLPANTMNHFTLPAARVCPQQALLAPCFALPAIAALQLEICMSPHPAVAQTVCCMQFRWPSVPGMPAAHRALWFPQGLPESMLWRSALTALQSLGRWAMERYEVPGCCWCAPCAAACTPVDLVRACRLPSGTCVAAGTQLWPLGAMDSIR